MAEAPLRVALLGCGMMGARHLRGHAELERTIPGSVNLVAVCDIDPARANAVADEAAQLFGRRPAVLTDRAALADCGAEAVDVVTPNRCHDNDVVALLDAGLHVLVEKPLAVTIERGQRMLAAAANSGRVLAVAENNRRDPMNRLARHAVRAGAIGAVRTVSIVDISQGGKVVGTPWRHRLAMGGLPLDVWIHMGYVTEFVAGPLTEVHARGGLACRERIWTRPDGGAETVVCEGYDHLTAALWFESGAGGTWHANYAARGYGQTGFIVLGDEGTLHVPPSRSGRPVRLQRDGETLEGDALVAELPDWSLSEPEAALWGQRPGSYQLESPVTDRKLIAAELADFAAAVRERRAPEVPGKLGLRSVAIIYALLESAEAGRPVSIAEVFDGRVRAFQDRVEAAGGEE